MRRLVAEAGREDEIEIDSAGTGDWHVGHPPDERATAAAAERGIELEGEARQVTRGDFDDYDLIVAMDRANERDLRALGAGRRQGRPAALVRPGGGRGGRPRRAGPLLRGRRRLRARARRRRARRARAAEDPVRTYVSAASPPGLLPSQAAGMRWLAEGPLRVPEVVSVSDDELVMERVEPGAAGGRLRRRARPRPRRAARAGRRPLRRRAHLHRPAGGPRAGLRRLALLLRAGPARTAAADGRRRRHARRPRAGRARHRPAARPVRPAEPPARLHGDLWSGNVMAGPDGAPWLIDPTRLRRPPRDRPRDARALRLAVGRDFFAAYEDVTPLADGWRERVDLYQLLPLLVHAVLFGGSLRRRRRPRRPPLRVIHRRVATSAGVRAVGAKEAHE